MFARLLARLPRPRYLSVRTKVVLFAVIILAITSTSFVLLELNYQARHREDLQTQQYRRTVDLASRLMKIQAARLHGLGMLMADLPGVREALRAGDAVVLDSGFSPFWSDFNLIHGLDSVAFFSATGDTLGLWGLNAPTPYMPVLAREAVMRETPLYRLECGARCVYLAAVPLVEGGRNLGVEVLAMGLQDFIMDFRDVSGAELAFLESPTASPCAITPARDARLLSASGGSLYQDLARRYVEQADGAPIHATDFGGRHFLIYGFPIDEPGGEQLRILVMHDVTAERVKARAAALTSVALGILVLLLAVVTLYLLQRPTMNRLGKALHALPLLGEGRFQEARAAFQGRAPLVRDEVHDLGLLASELADTLEHLQRLSREHAVSLQNQARQLEQERDFIAGLLDTAPVLILTHADDGRIRLANANAIQAVGLTPSEVIGHDFPARFLRPDLRAMHMAALREMEPGEVVHNESEFTRANGEVRDVVWFHSCQDTVGGERLYLSVGLDVTDYREVERSLNLLEAHDGVTGLLNRRAFKRELDARLARGESGALLLCDIDEFKLVNETGGHEAGDGVLNEFVRQARELNPPPTLAARLGGDDFALMIVGIGTAEAILLARALNQAMSHAVPPPGLEHRRLSVCVGVVGFPEHGDSADALLANGEIALVQARAKGHASWHLYSPDDPYHEVAGRRAYWSAELEKAIEEGRLVLHFQPIQCLVTGRVGHYEALLRLRANDGRLVPPGMFIDVAESTGLIRSVDRWVVEAGVAFAAAHPDIKLAINLSSRSFDDESTFEIMRAALARHGVGGHRLLLEITETAALANFASTTRIMALFKGLGCAFGLDDFGVGYSSFQYLKELPVDFVKIDGSFIKGLTRNSDDVVFVRALNDAVQGFGKTTIAEFVEDEATLAILREIGVDYAQGYLIGRPAPELVMDGGGWTVDGGGALALESRHDRPI
jgi:diguanylate cyclase (GGDEF)-like protein/PAS domain S-box-containing protein